MSGETENQVSGWTVDTLREFMQKQLDDTKSMLQERYETQTKAVDAAFLAQQTAMQTALTAAERAVATALLSAEKAVAKAEAAADKRFESVNEFRSQLSDQAGTFISRVEADARRAEQDSRFSALSEKLNTATGRNEARTNDVEKALTSRLDLQSGRTQGIGAGWNYLVGFAGLVFTVLAIVGVVLGTR